MITPRIDLSKLNAIPAPQTAKSLRASILRGTRRMYGSSVTHGGCAPYDPDMAAAQFVRFGQNHARLHHLEAVKDKDLPRVLAFMDALYKRGARCSVSITSLVAKEQARYAGDFYADLYSGNESAEKVYAANLERVRPLLIHPGCFMASLCNEPTSRISPDMAQTFWQKWSPTIRKINPDIILTDGGDPDAWYHGQAYTSRTADFAQVAQNYDVGTAHMYGDDPAASGKGSWVEQPDYWRRILEFRAASGRPLFVNELGSYATNPNQGSNLAFAMLEAMRLGASVTHYNWCDRAEHDDKGNNAYAVLRDPKRLILMLLGAYLCKYGEKDALAVWQGKGYGCQWSKGFGDRERVEIQVSKTKRLIFGLDKDEPWLLVRAV